MFGGDGEGMLVDKIERASKRREASRRHWETSATRRVVGRMGGFQNTGAKGSVYSTSEMR